jgi:hypothetical protein
VPDAQEELICGGCFATGTKDEISHTNCPGGELTPLSGTPEADLPASAEPAASDSAPANDTPVKDTPAEDPPAVMTPGPADTTTRDQRREAAEAKADEIRDKLVHHHAGMKKALLDLTDMITYGDWKYLGYASVDGFLAGRFAWVSSSDLAPSSS